MEPASTTNEFLRGINARAGELRARAEQAQAALAEILMEVRSRDGLATVTVGAGGIMRGLTVSGTRAAPEQLSGSIMAAYQEGCRRAAQQAADIMERHAPGSPAVAMMRDAVPPDPDEIPEEQR